LLTSVSVDSVTVRVLALGKILWCALAADRRDAHCSEADTGTKR